jgi:hypothetical protein
MASLKDGYNNRQHSQLNRVKGLRFSESFNLNELLQREHDLQDLVNPFTHEEINGIVMDLPSGNSPGPNKFNTYFMKKYWG